MEKKFKKLNNKIRDNEESKMDSDDGWQWKKASGGGPIRSQSGLVVDIGEDIGGA